MNKRKIFKYNNIVQMVFFYLKRGTKVEFAFLIRQHSELLHIMANSHFFTVTCSIPMKRHSPHCVYVHVACISPFYSNSCLKKSCAKFSTKFSHCNKLFCFGILVEINKYHRKKCHQKKQPQVGLAKKPKLKRRIKLLRLDLD